jgi:hypothetical protein
MTVENAIQFALLAAEETTPVLFVKIPYAVRVQTTTATYVRNALRMRLATINANAFNPLHLTIQLLFA